MPLCVADPDTMELCRARLGPPVSECARTRETASPRDWSFSTPPWGRSGMASQCADR